MEPMTYLETLAERYPILEKTIPQIRQAYEMLEECYAGGGKLLVAGNGGSCADSEHIVGELMKGFVKRRAVSEEEEARLKRAGLSLAEAAGLKENLGQELAGCLQGGLKAIALTGHNGLSTAFLNDVRTAALGLRRSRRCLSGDFHIGKFKKYFVRHDSGKSKGPQDHWPDRERRRNAGQGCGCRYHSAGRRNLQDSGTPPASLPCFVSDAGGAVF